MHRAQERGLGTVRGEGGAEAAHVLVERAGAWRRAGAAQVARQLGAGDHGVGGRAQGNDQAPLAVRQRDVNAIRATQGRGARDKRGATEREAPGSRHPGKVTHRSRRSKPFDTPVNQPASPPVSQGTGVAGCRGVGEPGLRIYGALGHKAERRRRKDDLINGSGQIAQLGEYTQFWGNAGDRVTNACHPFTLWWSVG